MSNEQSVREALKSHGEKHINTPWKKEMVSHGLEDGTPDLMRRFCFSHAQHVVGVKESGITTSRESWKSAEHVSGRPRTPPWAQTSPHTSRESSKSATHVSGRTRAPPGAAHLGSQLKLGAGSKSSLVLLRSSARKVLAGFSLPIMKN
jgi:hypothetical protein